MFAHLCFENKDYTQRIAKYILKGTTTYEKVKNGYKICRFAQFPKGKGILPSVLEELLKARN